MSDERVVYLLNNNCSPYLPRNIDYALSAGCINKHMEAFAQALISGDYKTIGVITRASITEFWEHEAESIAAMEFTRSLG